MAFKRSAVRFRLAARQTNVSCAALNPVANNTTLVSDFLYLAEDDNDDGVADAATHVRKLGLFEGVDVFDRVTPAGKGRARYNHQRQNVERRFRPAGLGCPDDRDATARLNRAVGDVQLHGRQPPDPPAPDPISGCG